LACRQVALFDKIVQKFLVFLVEDFVVENLEGALLARLFAIATLLRVVAIDHGPELHGVSRILAL
jgi:hypothetical protein